MVLSVQYLRGIAALMVLLEHIGVKSAQYSTNSLAGWHVGGAGVDLFFLISGFIMCHTTDTKHQQTGASRNFLWRRILRIIPLYWLVTCAALVVFILAPDKVNSGGGETGILSSFFLLPTDQLYLVANGWTLRYEFLFYFIFMVGLFFGRGVGRLAVAGIIISLVSIGQWLTPNSPVGKFVSDPLLLEFVAGMVLYHAYGFFQHLHKQALIPSVVLLGLGLGGLMAVNQGIHSNIRIIDFGIPMLFLMAGALCLEPVLRQRPIQLLKKLGDSSYAMYLVHPFVIAAGAMIITKLHFNNTFDGMLFNGLLLILSLVVGYLVHELVEKTLTRIISAIKFPIFSAKAKSIS